MYFLPTHTYVVKRKTGERNIEKQSGYNMPNLGSGGSAGLLFYIECAAAERYLRKSITVSLCARNRS